MKKNTIIKNILVEKLIFGGKGFAKLKSDNTGLNGKTIIISGGVIPGSIVNLRVIKSKKDYIEAQCMEVIKKSSIEVPYPQNIYGKQAGLKWVNIPYNEQLKIKQQQIEESMFYIKKLQNNFIINPIIPSPLIDKYRNKIEFSFGKYISEIENKNEQFNVGFHKQGEFSKVEDFDGTILISNTANNIYKEIKSFTKQSGYPVYDNFNGEGFYRHIIIREGFFTNQIMIILGINHKFEGVKSLKFLKDFLIGLTKKYKSIKSIYLSLNSNKADIAIGELEIVYGKEYIEETLLGLTFNISPTSFFQTNSYGAEKLYSEVLNQINLELLKNSIVLDLYGGTGTIGMIFSKYAKKVISVELNSDASNDGMQNASKNNITNMDFINNKVEDFLGDYLKKDLKADLLIIDPPRVGMHKLALPNIIKFKTKNIIYISCNPATLSRDLDYILQNSDYKIIQVTPVDMFPHTHHIETIVKLERI